MRIPDRLVAMRPALAAFSLPLPAAGILVATDGRPDPIASAGALFAIWLVFLHVLVTNNLSDIGADAGRPFAEACLRLGRKRLVTLSILLLVAGLSLGFALEPRLAAISAAISAGWAAYALPPLRWKANPVAATLVHVVLGAAHVAAGTIGVGGDVRKTAALSLWFGLAMAAGHFAHLVEDADRDEAAGLSTWVTRLGREGALGASNLLFGAALAAAPLHFVAGGRASEAALLALPNAAILARSALRRVVAPDIAATIRFYRSAYAVAGALFAAAVLAR